MIRNEDELTMARRRLALLQDELAILRFDVLREDRRTHHLLCEYFDKRIEAVTAEIDAYQAALAAPPGEKAAEADISAVESVHRGMGRT